MSSGGESLPAGTSGAGILELPRASRVCSEGRWMHTGRPALLLVSQANHQGEASDHELRGLPWGCSWSRDLAGAPCPERHGRRSCRTLPPPHPPTHHRASL